jgi:small GTP-binding protein
MLPGQTTDPVKKSIEINGIGPVIMIDTAGIDDVGELGAKRVKKTIEALKIIDLAILVVAHNQFDSVEINLIEQFFKDEIPFVVVMLTNRILKN